MTKYETADLETSQTLVFFLEDEKTIVDNNELLKEEVAAFIPLVVNFENAKIASETAPAATAADRNVLKKNLAATTSTIFTFLTSYAAAKKLPDLATFCSVSKSSMEKLTDEDFKKLMEKVVEKVGIHADDLLRYRFSKESQVAFIAEAKTYSSLKPQVTVETTKSTFKTEAVKETHQAVKDFLKFRLDVAVGTETEENPIFVKHYFDLREGRTVVVSYTQLILKIMNEAGDAPMPLVDVVVPELKFKGKTDDKGKIIIRVGNAKVFTVKCSKEGMEPKEIALKKIPKGTSQLLEVKMIAIAAI